MDIQLEWANKKTFTPSANSILSYNQNVENVLRILSARSTCPEKKVSAMIIGNTSGRSEILSIGINGAHRHRGGEHTPLYMHMEWILPERCSIGIRVGRSMPPLCRLSRLFIPYLMIKIVKDPSICRILGYN